MAAVEFTVSHHFDAPAEIVWSEMIDWPSHGQWIPATRVEIEDETGPGQSVDSHITGYTGYGPLTLVDRMRISAIDWDAETESGACEVEKLGPVLRGRAGFTVQPDLAGSRVDWFEDVTVPYLPRVLSPLVSRLSAVGFGMGMKKLASIIDRSTSGAG